MNVLQISEFFPSKDLRYQGGVETRNLEIARYLSKRHRVIVITSNSAPRGNFLGPKVLIRRVGSKRTYNASIGDFSARVNFLIHAIKVGVETDADIVEGTNFLTHIIAKVISIRSGIPSVAWCPDIWIGEWVENVGFAGLIGEVLERFNLLFNFDAYITLSNITKNKLQKIGKKNIFVISCGVNRKEFSNKIEKRNQTTIICISRLTKYKNINTLILAFALLNKNLPSTRLIIIGSGPHKKNIEDLIDNLKLKNSVKMYSNLKRPQMISILKSSHIFSLPSKVEGFGITSIEAIASGLPYVNSDINVFKEVLKNGIGGYLVEVEDPYKYFDRFMKLINNRGLYKRKVKEGQSLLNIYNWNRIGELTEAVYSKII